MITITIEGPYKSGKSTIAAVILKALAAENVTADFKDEYDEITDEAISFRMNNAKAFLKAQKVVIRTVTISPGTN